MDLKITEKQRKLIEVLCDMAKGDLQNCADCYAAPFEKELNELSVIVRMDNSSDESSGLHLQRVSVSESDIDAMFPYEDIETDRPTRPENRIRAYNSRQADRREGAKRLLEKLHSR